MTRERLAMGGCWSAASADQGQQTETAEQQGGRLRDGGGDRDIVKTPSSACPLIARADAGTCGVGCDANGAHVGRVRCVVVEAGILIEGQRR